MSLFQKHKKVLLDALEANASRAFYTPFPEHPKSYDQKLDQEGKTAFFKNLNTNFEELGIEAEKWVGSEISPYMQVGLGISYPALSTNKLTEWSKSSNWSETSLEQRTGILMESLFRAEKRYFEMAYATMHTTGQGLVMAFQASGPHANDRALEAITVGYEALRKYPSEVNWVKPLGKQTLSLKKTYKSIPRGIGLVIGCSTFPGWNSVPGIYANLITGNSCIVKPHPKAIYPIAVYVSELRQVMREQGLDPNAVLLAPDSPEEPITKQLAEHPDIKLIDYTGGTEFGNYIEGLGKPCFTEKSGINNIYLEEVEDLEAVAWNLAFSICLYSGQMCTAPQNIFIPADGVKSKDKQHSYEEAVDALKKSIDHILSHPKMGVQTLGAVQNDALVRRIQDVQNKQADFWQSDRDLVHPDYPNARLMTPTLVELKSEDTSIYAMECFGPMVMVIRVEKDQDPLDLIGELSRDQGAITCGVYTQSSPLMKRAEKELNALGIPVSFNFAGMAFINQHAAFSDFHGTGNNPAGNASFVDSGFVNKRFQWIGNRYYVG
jgi:phenylacetic acid degradation protein paaN